MVCALEKAPCVRRIPTFGLGIRRCNENAKAKWCFINGLGVKVQLLSSMHSMVDALLYDLIAPANSPSSATSISTVHSGKLLSMCAHSYTHPTRPQQRLVSCAAAHGTFDTCAGSSVPVAQRCNAWCLYLDPATTSTGRASKGVCDRSELSRSASVGRCREHIKRSKSVPRRSRAILHGEDQHMIHRNTRWKVRSKTRWRGFIHADRPTGVGVSARVLEESPADAPSAAALWCPDR